MCKKCTNSYKTAIYVNCFMKIWESELEENDVYICDGIAVVECSNENSGCTQIASLV